MESSSRQEARATADGSLLAIERVCKRRANGRHSETVLDAVSFAIAPGECIGVRGPRRSGKTTLLRIAAGIESPDSGDVIWQRRPVTALPRRERTRRLREIGFVAQSAAWRAAPGKPMLDHIALPLLIAGVSVTEAVMEARSAAEQVGADAFVDASPHELTPDALTRLALARALVHDPRLLIVDDPGGGGGDAEQRELHGLLRALARERPAMAMLIASREIAPLHGCDCVMTLDGTGRLRVPEHATARVVPFPATGAPAS